MDAAHGLLLFLMNVILTQSSPWVDLYHQKMRQKNPSEWNAAIYLYPNNDWLGKIKGTFQDMSSYFFEFDFISGLLFEKMVTGYLRLFV